VSAPATREQTAATTAGRQLPVRGADVRELGLTLPPARMPRIQRGRPLKRWRYVGVYGPEWMLCVGDARIGPVPQRWWAIATPDGELIERTTLGRAGLSLAPGRVSLRAPGLELELELDEGRPGAVETVSPATGGYIWTRKHGDVAARGEMRFRDRRIAIEAPAFIDESAGYHGRHTQWRWSAGVGRARRGERVAWNLVAGIHDAERASERSVWVDGEPHEVPPAEFAADLSGVSLAGGEGELRFKPWATREEDVNLLLMRSRYRQPFGTFSGTLPGVGELAEGYGVMEEHDVLW